MSYITKKKKKFNSPVTKYNFREGQAKGLNIIAINRGLNRGLKNLKMWFIMEKNYYDLADIGMKWAGLKPLGDRTKSNRTLGIT